MKKKQILSVPSSCQVFIKKNTYIFSGSLGKTIMNASRCDALGNRFRTNFKKNNHIKTTFLESYTSKYTPFLSSSKSRSSKKIFFKTKKPLERDFFEKSWNGEKNPFENILFEEKKQNLCRQGSLRPMEAKMNGSAYGYALFLKLIGLGYKFSLYPSQKFQNMTILSIKVGHSHKIKFFIPESVGMFLFPRNTLALFSSEKEIIANLAYQIRHVRPPTPYKGKGIRFLNEVVLLKEGKKTK